MMPGPLPKRNAVVVERRLGRFAYSYEFLQNSPSEVLKNLFGRLVPVDVKFDFVNQRFEIVAFGEEFDPVDLGEEVPIYHPTVRIIQRKSGLAYYVSFEKEKLSPLQEMFQ